MLLREMLPTDLDFVREARNQESVRQCMYTTHEIAKDEHEAWYARASGDQTRRDLIAVDDEGQRVGVVNFTEIDPVNGTGHWAFYSSDTTRRGIGSQMERVALDYAFTTLNLRKLWCEVLSFNKSVIKLHRKHGFLVEGIFRKAHLGPDDIYHDIYRLALSRDHWVETQTGNIWIGTTANRLFTLTAGDIHAFADLTGDTNSRHTGEKPIAHGLLTASKISAILGTVLPGEGTIYRSQNLRFTAMVSPGDQLTAQVKVITQIGRKLTLETTVTNNETGIVVIEGEAVVSIPEDL